MIDEFYYFKEIIKYTYYILKELPYSIGDFDIKKIFNNELIKKIITPKLSSLRRKYTNHHY